MLHRDARQVPTAARGSTAPVDRCSVFVGLTPIATVMADIAALTLCATTCPFLALAYIFSSCRKQTRKIGGSSLPTDPPKLGSRIKSTALLAVGAQHHRDGPCVCFWSLGSM